MSNLFSSIMKKFIEVIQVIFGIPLYLLLRDPLRALYYSGMIACAFMLGWCAGKYLIS